MALSLLVPRLAQANEMTVCQQQRVGSGAPIRAPMDGADLLVLSDACPSTGIFLEAKAHAVIAEEDFYGRLLAGMALRGKLQISPNFWLSLYAPGVEYRFVANATVEAEKTSLGGTMLGAHHTIALHRMLSIAPFLRTMLPTETVFQHARRGALEWGVSLYWRPSQWLDVIGGVVHLFLFTGNGAVDHVAESLAVSTDVIFRPAQTFAIGLGTAVRSSLNQRPAFDAIDLRGSLRVYPWKAFSGEIQVSKPFGGFDRSTLALQVSIGYAWDRFLIHKSK